MTESFGDKLVEALRFRSDPLSLSEPLREDGDAAAPVVEPLELHAAAPRAMPAASPEMAS